MPSHYRSLHVYKLADALATDVTRLVRGWPRWERRELGSQLVRAVNSVPCNIAEACGKRTTADRRRVLRIALGEAMETHHLLCSLQRLELIPPQMPDRGEHVVRVLHLFMARPGGRD
jgi:four helix bundle protein